MPPPVMETVAMVLSAQPVPPMPIVVGQEVPDEITAVSGEHRVANSHDLWSMLMVTAMERQNDEENVARALTQQALMRTVFEEVKRLQEDRSLDGGAKEQAVYDLFSRFTRENVTALSSSRDLRFAPLETVAREDRVHIAACHHAAAQDILFGPLKTDGATAERRTAEEFSEFPYTSLMMRQFARLCDAEAA